MNSVSTLRWKGETFSKRSLCKRCISGATSSLHTSIPILISRTDHVLPVSSIVTNETLLCFNMSYWNHWSMSREKKRKQKSQITNLSFSAQNLTTSENLASSRNLLVGLFG